MLLLALPAALAQSPNPFVTTPPEKPTSIWAQGTEGIGVGVVLGLPTGLNAAYRPGGKLWGQADLAWSFENDTFALNVDLLYTVATPSARNNLDFRFPIYVGVGPRFRLGEAAGIGLYNDSVVGLRLPVGMVFSHENFPLEGFLELAPGIGLVPGTRGLFDAGVGLRFFLPGTGRTDSAATEP